VQEGSGASFASPGEKYNCLFSTELSRAGITMIVNGRDFCFTIKLSGCGAKIVTSLLPIPACYGPGLIYLSRYKKIVKVLVLRFYLLVLV